jgi:Sec-independent protein translocase protein TatA
MSLSEMFFLALLGLVVFGPKKLAEIAQKAGQLLARFKKVSGEFQSQLAMEISAAGNDRNNNRNVVQLTAEARQVETGLSSVDQALSVSNK